MAALYTPSALKYICKPKTLYWLYLFQAFEYTIFWYRQINKLVIELVSYKIIILSLISFPFPLPTTYKQ